VLAVVALYMGVESIRRFFSPVPIHFNEAIFVAVIGLIVNVVSAFLLQENHHPAHEDDTEHEHHQDHNLRAAYLHVLADAVTSLLAIVALLAGKGFGWIWMDPIMGVVGAVVITRWSYGLLRETSKILLDSGVSQETISAIRTVIEEDSDNRVADLHVWRLGSHHLAAEISVVTHFPKPPSYYKEMLEPFGLAHIIIEVNSCSGEPCLVPI
jgi:cation diffusion facilitator family transporter